MLHYIHFALVIVVYKIKFLNFISTDMEPDAGTLLLFSPYIF